MYNLIEEAGTEFILGNIAERLPVNRADRSSVEFGVARHNERLFAVASANSL